MKEQLPKYSKYQDYVIKDNTFVGEFEQMYKDYSDPWHQSFEDPSTEKDIAISWMKKLNANRVMELGCGLGYFSSKIQKAGMDVVGLDISSTAISKAQMKFPECRFQVGDILDYSTIINNKPDVIVLADITWYILEKLDAFIQFFKEKLKGTYLIHLLTTYPLDTQTYGKEKFSDLDSIMEYFGLTYIEWGRIDRAKSNSTKTFFLGR